MEYCQGGELLDKFTKNDLLNEDIIKKYMKILFKTIKHCHAMSIIHCDIKLENILFKSNDEDSEIKIIDFGLSKKFSKINFKQVLGGTAYYMSPEVIDCHYDYGCDIWSLGICMYILLCGDPPFVGEDNIEVFEKIKKMPLKFDENKWENVSGAAKNLVIKILQKNPSNRPTLDEILNDEWFKITSKRRKSNILHHCVLKRLQSYKNDLKFKKEIISSLIN